ncbi:MAG: phage portal protein [Dichotomicrobium sp.]
MRILGLEISRAKAVSVLGGGGRDVWWPLIRESFSGAWQRGEKVKVEDTLSYWPVFRCVSLIASDIAKLRLDLVEETSTGVWQPTQNPAFSPVLRKPNRYQTRIQFYESWLQSKLTRGNTYVLKERDQRGVVVAMYVLDPTLVKPLVSANGEVFYDLSIDYLSGLTEKNIVVPASEIIHDRWNAFYHPLCGLSPIYAAATKALAGLRMQNASSKFFEKGALPSGILSAPGTITNDTAERLKEHWENNYSGANAGKVAVLGDGLKFERMTVTAEDSQLIEQLKWTAEAIAGAFGVPVYMIMGTPPTYNNVQALTQQYYSQCLQILIESIEILLDEGLGLTRGEGRRRYATRFNLDDLLRMDTRTMISAEAEAVGAGIRAPNESRQRLGQPPVEGGDSPLMQQQVFSLAALAERDEAKPFATPPDAAPASPPEPSDNDDDDDDGMDDDAERAAFIQGMLRGELLSGAPLH